LAAREPTSASKAYRGELFDPKIGEHHGRIVNTTGEGMLVEFSHVVDAVRCAAEVQQGMIRRNAAIAPGERIEFRVGINLGYVIVEGEHILASISSIAADHPVRPHKNL
jgi:adenylate cyclase